MNLSMNEIRLARTSLRNASTYSHLTREKKEDEEWGESLLQHHLTMTYSLLAKGRLVHLLPHI
jgi:hypothetical protein